MQERAAKAAVDDRAVVLIGRTELYFILWFGLVTQKLSLDHQRENRGAAVEHIPS